jgi:antirestriction protein
MRYEYPLYEHCGGAEEMEQMMNPNLETRQPLAPNAADEPKLWVGCLSCYNAGRLHGDWFDAQACEFGWFGDLLALRPDPGDNDERCAVCGGDEWWGMDVEGLPASWSEEMSPADFVGKCVLRDQLEGQGYDIDAYVAYEDNVGREYANPDEFMDAYCGHYDSEEDYAQELADDLGVTREQTPAWPYSHIDWEGAARDLFMSDYYSVDCPTGGVYVFRAT